MTNDSEEVTGRAGGLARAEALTDGQRKEIASKAAKARWSEVLPEATHEGVFSLGEAQVIAAVIHNPTPIRVLNQATFLRAIGRSRSPKAGTGVMSTVDGLPFFLQAEALQPFISNELRGSTAPIVYRSKTGKKAIGYNAELLPAVGEVYLKLRDAYLLQGKPVPAQYKHIVWACDLVMRGLARVGIVALVDEATGFQDVRHKEAMQEVLQRYLRKEVAAWVKRFPDEFYKQIYRLRGWEWRGMEVNRISACANYTNDLIYERITPGLLKEMEIRNPVDEKGRRKTKNHQWLTEEIGIPKLAEHFGSVMTLQKISNTWDEFYSHMNRWYPRRGDTIPIEFGQPSTIFPNEP